MRRLRVVSFNILHGKRADGSGVVDLPLLCRAAAALEPDVLALQEVDVGVPRSGRKDQAAAVGEATGLSVAFGKATRVGGVGKYGNALLARGAITDVDVVALPRAARGNEPRSAIAATVTIDDVRLTILGTHLSIHRPEVHEQLVAVLELAARRNGPRIVVGDFNLGPHEVVDAADAHGFALADPSLPTYPRHDPRERIDHVLVDAVDFEIVSVEVVSTDSSDHCALVVEVALRP